MKMVEYGRPLNCFVIAFHGFIIELTPFFADIVLPAQNHYLYLWLGFDRVYR